MQGMDMKRTPRTLIPRPRIEGKQHAFPLRNLGRRRATAPSWIRPWLPVLGSALAVAIAIFSLPTVLAIDLAHDAAEAPQNAFPVTVDAERKVITEDPAVEELLTVAPSGLAAAANLADLAYTWLAVRISETAPYRQVAGIAGIDSLFVTIYPGQRAEEVAAAFGSKLEWTKAERAAFLKEVEATEPGLPDGQFVPGTYFIGVTSPDDVAHVTQERFNAEILSRYSSTTEARVPLEDAIIIASLLEREAGGWEDMRLISGVIWNRLFIGMNLQIDATMQYSKSTLANGEGGWWPTPIPADKNIRHAYNTYRRSGLPPGPIASPSIAAVVAALNPKKTDCLFYFHDQYGRFHCSPNYEGHVALLKKHYGQGR
jgi:UPF0755 protein